MSSLPPNYLAALILALAGVVRADEQIDFSSQVRPILSDKCFHCHGPDAQNQDSAFRADTKANLFADLGGYAAVVPGDLSASELHKRINSDDPSEQMPPPDSNRTLTQEQVRILDLWIKQGAPYETHWAFTPPKRSAVPETDVAETAARAGWEAEVVEQWTRNPIDVFIARGLLQAGLEPSATAEPQTLLRRASLTLTGMLPTPEQRAAYEGDSAENQYDNAVEKLLESDAYAERQTLLWLDAARYADTDGYQNDYGRTNWPWRDWVIMAFRDNMPFDQFTIEQLAGDMLPTATDLQRLASAFNRNHRQNAEGGALAAEFAVENVIDRVETTSTVWLGLTMGCCRCHDHKYDPISQREFFQFYGYFNNIGEQGIGKGVEANPTMVTGSPLAEVPIRFQLALADAQKRYDKVERSLDDKLALEANRLRRKYGSLAEAGEVWRLVDAPSAVVDGPGTLEPQADGSLLYKGEAAQSAGYRLTLKPRLRRLTAVRIEALPDSAFGQPRQLAPSANGNFVLTDLKVTRNGEPVRLESAVASFEQPGYPAVDAIDDNTSSGWAVFSEGPGRVNLTLQFAEPVELSAAESLEMAMRFDSAYSAHFIGKLRVYVTDSPNEAVPISPETLAVVEKPLGTWTEREKQTLREHLKRHDDEYLEAKAALDAAQLKVEENGGKRVSVMVMREREGDPAPAYLLDRGQYDQPVKNEPLERAAPAALFGESGHQPQDRLELAEWVVSRANPLTARVIVNRIWQSHFGAGLVRTSDDFGVQGEVPSHPELLDWLAVEFIDSGWDIKAMHRLIVTSAAYRQASHTSKKLLATDPQNLLLARGPRYRADGFVIRDIALQSSGLLNPELGGPPVKPYQPDGLWEVVAANAGTQYKSSSGKNLYRKSMYSYWKRAVNPPRQTIFDAGGREVCNVRVRRTNTPLQALVLLNDPTFVEAARRLAERVVRRAELTAEERIARMYELAVARDIPEKTLSVLEKSFAYFRKHFDERPIEAQQLIGTGESPRDKELDSVEHAAMTAVAHIILNLDEYITIE